MIELVIDAGRWWKQKVYNSRVQVAQEELLQTPFIPSQNCMGVVGFQRNSFPCNTDFNSTKISSGSTQFTIKIYYQNWTCESTFL